MTDKIPSDPFGDDEILEIEEVESKEEKMITTAPFIAPSKDAEGFVKTPILRGFTEIEPLYHAITERNGLIAGGYARYCASPWRNPVKSGDVDIFPQTEQAYKDIVQLLVNELGFAKQHENDVSFTLAHSHEGLKAGIDPRWRVMPTLQIIKPVNEGAILTVGDLETILQNFDFTVVRIAIISPTECLADANFKEDEQHKFLRIKNIHCPVSSALRFMKYAKKGYFTRPMEMLKLFTEWNDRGPEYQDRLFELFAQSKLMDSNGNPVEMSEKDIDELESLLRVD